MFRFVFKKIRSKKWMSLCLVLGIALLAAVCSSHFIFKNGAENEIINRKFSDYFETQNEYPGVAKRNYLSSTKNYKDIASIRNSLNGFESKWIEYLELPKLDHQFDVVINVNAHNKIGARLAYLENLSEHVEIVDGESLKEGDTKSCLITEETMDNLNICVGDEIVFSKLNDGTEIKVKVVGICKKTADDDNFWCDDLRYFNRCLLVNEEFISELVEKTDDLNLTIHFSTLFDYTKIDHSNAAQLVEWIKEIKNQDDCFDSPMIGIIESCRSDIERVSTLLYALEIPIIMLLIIFIYMISSTMIMNEEGEIAVLRSRGIKGRKIVGLYVLQALFLSIFAGFIGLALGIILCRLAASASSFLAFSGKDVSNYIISWEAIVGALIGVGISIVSIVLPIIPKSRLTIVKQKAESGQRTKKAIWEKAFLDIILIAVSIYLLINYNRQLDSIIKSVINNEELDPFVFLNSSLFIFAMGLFFIRLIGLVITAFYNVFKNRFKAWSFASLTNLKRTFRAQSFIAIFIIMTIGNSIFNANLARSINNSAEARIKYDSGCDLRIREYFRVHSSEDKDGPSSVYYDEPSYGKYIDAREQGLFAQSTKVVVENVMVETEQGNASDVTVFAIHTKEFGEIAKLDDGLNSEHWFNALNALAQTPNGVIVDREFAEANNLEIGSRLVYSVLNSKQQYDGRIFVYVAAIIDAFPGYEKYAYEKGTDDVIVEKNKSLIVTNYAQLVSEIGVRPYEVWIKTDGNDEQRIIDYMQSNGGKIMYTKSMKDSIEEQNSSAMIQVTNGMFSINFIISITICITGFLVYWIMTVRNRELLFGVYRAMGVREGELSKMLLLEQLICSVSAAAAGALIGVVSSRLFIKLISVAYLPFKHIVEVKQISDISDMGIIAAGVAAMFLVCMFIITRIVKSMKISEALKLGED